MAPSTCSGEVDTGSPIRTCANQYPLEHVPIPRERNMLWHRAGGVPKSEPQDRSAAGLGSGPFPRFSGQRYAVAGPSGNARSRGRRDQARVIALPASPEADFVAAVTIDVPGL